MQMMSLRVFRAAFDLPGDLVLFDQRSVGGILGRGGTVLGSARCPEFLDPKMRRSAANLLQEMRVAALVVCGGEGSLAGAAALAAESGLQVLGVPASIDNDVPCTDACIGFDTAVNTLVECAQKIGDTAASHHRIMVLETMGRGSGQLAQTAALAAGAEIVVTPERPPLDKAKKLGIAQRIEQSFTHGAARASVVAKGAGRRRREGPPNRSPTFYDYFQRANLPYPRSKCG
jgi:6-phosphofructokinase 1